MSSFTERLPARKAFAKGLGIVFMIATIVSVLFLVILIASIVDQSFGYVLLVPEVDPTTLTAEGSPLEQLDAPSLVAILEAELGTRRLAVLEAEKPLEDRSVSELVGLVLEEVVQEKPEKTWTLSQSLAGAKAIKAWSLSEHPGSRLIFRSWVNAGLFTNPQSSSALHAGLRSAALGSLATILLTILVAFPIGVAAAIWLEEYARTSRFTSLVQLTIYNLAGVPSIIYGMLGLAIFVRALEPLTSGALVGAVTAEGGTGRTVLSASLTLALLVLPIIIINAQEALRAVPATLRQAGLALGATKWQTVWHHVLPASIDRILTGTVLAMSRALGETAPLVVVGAATFITTDPTGPFSRFTTLPIQIYQWTSRPQGEFKSLAAAAILVLLVLLLSLNASVIIARTRIRRRRRLGL